MGRLAAFAPPHFFEHFFRMKSFFVLLYTFFNAGIFTLYRECAQGSAQFASYGDASRRFVLCFPLSLLLPHIACTHALSLYRTHPSVCFALRWIKDSLVGNLGYLIWYNVAFSSMQHRLAVRETRPRNA